MSALSASATVARDSATDQAEWVHSSERVSYLDNLRLLLLLVVIVHHAAQPYAPTDGDWPVANAERSQLLKPLLVVNGAFMLAGFFLVAGFLLAAAARRKPLGELARGRLAQLGLPFLFFTLCVFGPIQYADYRAEAQPALGFGAYLLQVYIGQGELVAAHLWFIANLLVFSLVYLALVALRVPLSSTLAARLRRPPPLFALMLLVAGLSFLVRIVYPIDSWVLVGWLLPLEPAHLPLYIAMFVLGLAAYHGDWFTRLSTATGVGWLVAGLLAAGLRWIYAFGYPPPGGSGLPALLAVGGLDWRSLIWALWESLIGFGLTVGLLVLFRERANRSGPLLRLLSANAYGIYLLHFWVVIAVQVALNDLAAPPLLKCAAVVLIATPGSLLFSQLLRFGLRRARRSAPKLHLSARA